MLYNKKNNLYVFDNDEDFYNFCILPGIKVKYVGENPSADNCYMDFDFTNGYNDAVTAGSKFCINDRNSRVAKRKCVSYHTITKPVDVYTTDDVRIDEYGEYIKFKG